MESEKMSLTFDFEKVFEVFCERKRVLRSKVSLVDEKEELLVERKVSKY